MVSVNIIDGDYDIVDHETYQQIKHDYINDFKLRIGDIISKYDLNRAKWLKIRRSIIDETGFSRENFLKSNKRRIIDKIRQDNFKYYYNLNGRWRVCKNIGGEKVSFGMYDSEETAKRVVGELKKVDWDKNQLPRILHELEANSDEALCSRTGRYYTLNNCNKYVIRKTIDCKQVYFCSCKTEEEAKRIVEGLIACDWDKAQLDRIRGEFANG